jgi:O-6-methylguanine DNA methyltransferase
MTRPLASTPLDLGPVRAPQHLLDKVLDAVGLADRYIVRSSAIGDLLVAYNPRGVSMVLPVAAHGGVAVIEAEFRQRFGRPLHADAHPSSSFVRIVDRGLAGHRVQLQYDLRGVSEFGQAVLAKALEIPRGEVGPFGCMAAEIGRPTAGRGVGTALRRNPVPLLIPCHRVVRTDGRLGDYAFGSPAKVAVLEAEGYPLVAASR